MQHTWKNEKCIQNFGQKICGRDHFGDLGMLPFDLFYDAAVISD